MPLMHRRCRSGAALWLIAGQIFKADLDGRMGEGSDLTESLSDCAPSAELQYNISKFDGEVLVAHSQKCTHRFNPAILLMDWPVLHLALPAAI